VSEYENCSDRSSNNSVDHDRSKNVECYYLQPQSSHCENESYSQTYKHTVAAITACTVCRLTISLCVATIDKKLSYRRGTARRTVLVNSCKVSRGMGVRKVSNSKNDLQGHSMALTMVPFDRSHTISYSVPLQLCLYAPLTRYCQLFPKI